MTQAQLLKHLKDNCGCIVIREDSKGYAVVRNVINAKMSGVPKGSNANSEMRAATICRICKTLDVTIPEEAIQAAEVIDIIHKNHNKNK